MWAGKVLPSTPTPQLSCTCFSGSCPAAQTASSCVFENVSITREEGLMDGAWPRLGSYRSSGSAATASDSPSGSANDELDDFGHISSSHIPHPTPANGENNEDVAWSESKEAWLRSLWIREAAVDVGRACGVLLFGLFLFISESFCLEPRCAARGEKERKGRQVGTSGLSCSSQSTQKWTGLNGTGWEGLDRREGMLSCWLSNSWSLAPWLGPGATSSEAVCTEAVSYWNQIKLMTKSIWHIFNDTHMIIVLYYN